MTLVLLRQYLRATKIDTLIPYVALDRVFLKRSSLAMYSRLPVGSSASGWEMHETMTMLYLSSRIFGLSERDHNMAVAHKSAH